MKKAVIWYLMLWKRLLKKPGFLIILSLIPLMAFLLNMSADTDSGFLHIAIAIEGEGDSSSQQLVARMNEESEIFYFYSCKDAEEARGMVESSRADAAWVIPGDLSSVIADGAKKNSVTVATIYEREENIFLKLSREKIFCTLYPEISYNIYRNYLLTEFLSDKDVSEDDMYNAYRIFASDEKLVDFEYMDDVQNAQKADYLTSPLRGLFAIIILLCGLSSTMYFLSDEAEGTFSLLPRSKRIWVLAAGNLSALCTAAVFVTLALLLSGNYTVFSRESASMLAFLLSTTAFCTLLGAVISSLRIFGVLLPVLTVVCAVFCPIFVNIRSAKLLQILLPPYHYLFSVYDPTRIRDMLIYTVIVLPLAYMIYIITRKQTA